MDIIEDFKQQASDYLKDESQWIPSLFAKIERRTSLPREILAGVVVTLFSVYLVVGHFAQFVCNFVAFAGPAYESMLAIETPEKADDTQWLTYWTVFAVFSLFDFVGEAIWRWFPLHWLAKCIFLIYLYHPSIFGAKFMYITYVRGFLQTFSIFGRERNECNHEEQQADVQQFPEYVQQQFLQEGYDYNPQPPPPW